MKPVLIDLVEPDLSLRLQYRPAASSAVRSEHLATGNGLNYVQCEGRYEQEAGRRLQKKRRNCEQ